MMNLAINYRRNVLLNNKKKISLLSNTLYPKQLGFTLIELLVTITIIAILAAIGFPSYRYVVVSNRIEKNTHALRDSIALARSNALKTGLPTIVCPANDTGTQCSDTSDWSGGWLVSAATSGCNLNGINNTPIQKINSSSSYQIVTNFNPDSGSSNWLCFNRLGVAPTGHKGHFIFYITADSEIYKRCVIIAETGHTKTLRYNQTDSASGITCH